MTDFDLGTVTGFKLDCGKIMSYDGLSEYTVKFDDNTRTFYYEIKNDIDAVTGKPMANYYLKTYPNNFNTGEVFGGGPDYSGSYTGTLITQQEKDVKAELIELLRNDYDVMRVLRDQMRMEVRSALENDYDVRDIIRQAARPVSWGTELVDAVMTAIGTYKRRAEDNEAIAEHFNQLFIPVHKAKEASNDRAVKLV